MIEGLQTAPGAPKGARHVALYCKVHHAALDGAGGIALSNAILDVAPGSAQGEHARGVALAHAQAFGHRRTHGSRIAAQRCAVDQAGAHAADAGAIGLASTSPQRCRSRDLRQGPKGNWFAPRTPLNVTITNQRSFASVSLPLAEARRIAKGNAVTINEVVLAICSGALRHYLADVDALPADPLMAGVPVSLREAGNTEMNTQASMVRVSLASQIADPIARLQAIHDSSAAAKATMASMKSVMPTDFPSLGAPWLISGLAALFGRSKFAERMRPITNVSISNVPGPQFPLYLAGAKMLTYYPVSIAIHSVALNITVQSYNGSLDFGLTACRKAMPDVARLAGLIEAAHHELLKLTPADTAAEAPAPATPAPVRRRAAAGNVVRGKAAKGQAKGAAKASPTAPPTLPPVKLAASAARTPRPARTRRAA